MGLGKKASKGSVIRDGRMGWLVVTGWEQTFQEPSLWVHIGMLSLTAGARGCLQGAKDEEGDWNCIRSAGSEVAFGREKMQKDFSNK